MNNNKIIIIIMSLTFLKTSMPATVQPQGTEALQQKQ